MDETNASAASASLDPDAIGPDNLFKLAVEASPSGVLVVGPRGTIELVNLALEQQFGYARGELIGQPVEVLLPEPLQSIHAALRSDYSSDPRTRPMGAGRELFGRRKDGSRIPVEISLNAMHTPAGLLVLASVVDISERRRLEDRDRRELNERLEFERLFADISAAFVNLGAEHVDQAIIGAQRRIGEALDIDRSSVFQFSGGDDDFVLTHNWARLEEPAIPRRVSLREQFPWSLEKIRKGELV